MSAGRSRSRIEQANDFGAAIRRLRRDRGLSQREVAGAVPMSSANLSRIEMGDQGPPSDEVIVRLADALDAEADELLLVAGRRPARATFESQVLRQLSTLERKLDSGFGRVEAALTELDGKQQ
jgi:HTH-type transcriptional regulator, competence development regulator